MCYNRIDKKEWERMTDEKIIKMLEKLSNEEKEKFIQYLESLMPKIQGIQEPVSVCPQAN
jgi:hypothetical protein